LVAVVSADIAAQCLDAGLRDQVDIGLIPVLLGRLGRLTEPWSHSLPRGLPPRVILGIYTEYCVLTRAPDTARGQ
jgi:hypothetical protein